MTRWLWGGCGEALFRSEVGGSKVQCRVPKKWDLAGVATPCIKIWSYSDKVAPPPQLKNSDKGPLKNYVIPFWVVLDILWLTPPSLKDDVILFRNSYMQM